MTGGPGKEHETNKPPPTGRVQERSEGDITCLTTSQNPLWHPSWQNKACTTRKDSESERLAKDNPETNPITIKPETVSHSLLSLSAIRVVSSAYLRVVSSAYLRLLIFLLAFLIPACTSSSPTFCMMYSAYKLNKQGGNIQLHILLS